MVSQQLRADLIGTIPNLRAFAVSLCGNPDRADDLVQETLVKAWSNLHSFATEPRHIRTRHIKICYYICNCTHCCIWFKF